MEIFQKLPKRQPSLKKPISSLAQVALSSNQYALNVQRMEMILVQTTAPKVPGWASDGNFLQGHPKPAFSKKVQRGDQQKFFKNRPKSSPLLKGLKALCCKQNYRLHNMHLNCKDWKRFLRKRRHQKCSNKQVMAIFATSPKSRIF